MLIIDGSYGEGGGQILRTAVALSALTGKEIEIENIRAKRQKPGLQPQHLTAVESVRQICSGSVEGLEKGSQRILFKPGRIEGGKFEFDIGTAGSVPLVLQSVMLPAIFADASVDVKIKGGTDTKMAPPIDYLKNIFLPIISGMGAKICIELLRRGYYPKGGGEVVAGINPCKYLSPLLIKKRKISGIKGVVFASRLPEHVPQRISSSAEKRLKDAGFHTDIKIEVSDAYSPGTGITIWTYDTILGASALGEIGVPSEKVGAAAAETIISEIDSGATVDVHALDQIIPYMALASGRSSAQVREISMHAKTNMWLVERFLDVKFDVEKYGNLWKVSVEGVGFRR